MAELPIYSNFEEKQEVFRKSENFQINSASQFDIWYKEINSKQQSHPGNMPQLNLNDGVEEYLNRYNDYPYIFRGVGDAKYRIFSSAQRL